MKRVSSKATGYLLIVVGSTFAASLGVFYQLIDQRYHASAETMVFVRTCMALAVLLVALLGWQRKLLRIDRKSGPRLLAFGVFGQAFYSWAYARSIMVVGVSIAALMAYSALIWVSVYEWFTLREKPDGRKLGAMLIAFAGVFLVMRVHDAGGIRLSPAALGLSIVSGIAGASWTVLNKRAGQRSNPQVVVASGMLVSALVVGSTQNLAQVTHLLTAPGAIWWMLALGLGPALVGPLLWAMGLRRISASDASIVGAWEPVTACMLGFLVLGERLAPLQIVGAAAIVVSILVLSTRRTRTLAAAPAVSPEAAAAVPEHGLAERER
jgi:drug/metabolite transporter, DME family